MRLPIKDLYGITTEYAKMSNRRESQLWDLHLLGEQGLLTIHLPCERSTSHHIQKLNAGHECLWLSPF